MAREPIAIAKKFFEEQGMHRFTCCICGCEFYDWTGNNPDPVVPDDESLEELPVCCHRCNAMFVEAARQDKEPFKDIITMPIVWLEKDRNKRKPKKICDALKDCNAALKENNAILDAIREELEK